MIKWFKKKEIKQEEVKQEIKEEKKEILIDFDTINKTLMLDGVVYDFTIESEDFLQEAHKEEKLKLYKAENTVSTFRGDVFNTLLQLDRQVLIYMLLASQDKYSKHHYDDFKKYFYELIKKEPQIEHTLFVYANEMYMGYINKMGFEIQEERGREILQARLTQELLNIISTLPPSIKNTVNARMEELLKSLEN